MLGLVLTLAPLAMIGEAQAICTEDGVASVTGSASGKTVVCSGTVTDTGPGGIAGYGTFVDTNNTYTVSGALTGNSFGLATGGGTLTNGTVQGDTVVAGTIASTAGPTGRGVVYDAIDRAITAAHGKLPARPAVLAMLAATSGLGGATGTIRFDANGDTTHRVISIVESPRLDRTAPWLAAGSVDYSAALPY